MSWKKTKAEFDDIAESWERFIVPEYKTEIIPGCQEAIDRHKPRTILDVACGQGRSAIALKAAGFAVQGTDISQKMIKLARRNARDGGLRIPFTVAAWHELPAKVSKKFDFVMCQGNAIGHCRGERSMIRALKGIRKVTRGGGQLFLDTRSWEWFRSESASWMPGMTRDETDGHHTVIFHTHVPRKWSDPHVTEVVHVSESQGKQEIAVHPLTFYAFKVGELRSRLRRAGFGKIETNYEKGRSHYWVLCQAL